MVLYMHLRNCARAILANSGRLGRFRATAKLIAIRRGGGGVERMGGPLWPPALRVVKPCGEYTQGTTGDHKGPPRVHPTTLAPTDSWMRISGPLWNSVRGTGMPGFVRYAVFLALCLMLCLLSACGGINRPVMVHTTPTPATAAGEAVLPHSQIHFRDAPLPTRADLNVTSDDWMLAGHDSYSRRAVILPACCSTVTASPRPLWYHSLGVPLL